VTEKPVRANLTHFKKSTVELIQTKTIMPLSCVHLKPLQHSAIVSSSKDDEVKFSFFSILKLNRLALFDA